jgi:hypothetical protein
MRIMNAYDNGLDNGFKAKKDRTANGDSYLFNSFSVSSARFFSLLKSEMV